MNQSIEAVKARDRADQSTTLYFSDLEMYRRATRHAPYGSYDSYEELDEAMRHMAGPMPPPPTPDELARMAERWATTTTSAPVYTAADTAWIADAVAAAT